MQTGGLRDFRTYESQKGLVGKAGEGFTTTRSGRGARKLRLGSRCHPTDPVKATRSTEEYFDLGNRRGIENHEMALIARWHVVGEKMSGGRGKDSGGKIASGTYASLHTS